METTLAVVPARGGSRELRRKNLLPDASGIPLFLTSARAARDVGCQVIVATDDVDIRAIAEADGFTVFWRGPILAEVPVDVVVEAAAADHDGDVLLVQPTVQPVDAETLASFLNATTGRPVTLGVEDRHLVWHNGRVLSDRVERQGTAVWPIREVGVRWWPSVSSISVPPEGVITAIRPLVDIDTADDYRTLDRRFNIVFVTSASTLLGSGHLHRVVTLAEGLQRHNVSISLRDSSDDAYEFLASRGWPQHIPDRVDVVVHDLLDERSLIDAPTVNFETTRVGGVTVNELYGHGDYAGVDYAVLRPEFTVGDYQVRDTASKVLVLFGGTDPARLTALTVDALDGLDVDVLRPADQRSVSAAMRNADVLVTSGGRTVYEAAAVGVPTVVMAQNMRETTHTHLGVGNLYLGLGRTVDPVALRRTVTALLVDYPLRLDMSETAKRSIDGLGAVRCRRIIEHVAMFHVKP